MKRKIYNVLMITVACLTLGGCGSNDSEEVVNPIFEPTTETNATNSVEQKTENQNTADTAAAPSNDGSVSICDETTEFDYSKDYTEEIKVAVERAVASASSLDDEFKKIGEIEDHIDSRRNADENQLEMNVVSFYKFQVWDAELNNLWNRFSGTVDAQTKERVLADQRNWNAMKEEAALEALGPQDEGGSIYPLLYNSFMEDSTKVRCYFLAKEIAAASGASFTMPAKSITGSYIDNEGTDSVYSSLSITEGWESGYNAKASLYRIGEIEGSVEGSDGTLSFTSYDDNIKGIIHYGWDGATFEVTEVNGDAVIGVGEKFEFPLVF